MNELLDLYIVDLTFIPLRVYFGYLLYMVCVQKNLRKCLYTALLNSLLGHICGDPKLQSKQCLNPIFEFWG